MFAVLIDVLHTVGPALNVCGLLLAVTTELSTGEDDQGGEEPAVTQESHSELNGKFHVCRVNVDVEAEDDGQNEERGHYWEHPNSGPELSFLSPKLLPQTEPNEGDQGDGAVGKS